MNNHARAFVGCGDEVYPASGIEASTRPMGSGIRDEVLPIADAQRLQYGDLLDEVATHTGVGGEAYSANG